MTKLSPTDLETMDYNMPNWHKIYNRNMDVLKRLLYISQLQDINFSHKRDGSIFVWDDTDNLFHCRKYLPYLDAGVACNQDDQFTGSNGDPPAPLKWTVESGNPTIQNNRLRMIRTASGTSTDEVISTYTIAGDFDILIRFELDSPPATNNWYFNFGLRPMGYPSHHIGIAVAYYNNAKYFFHVRGTSYYGSIVRTNDSGLLRIQKIGNWLIFWYKDGIRDPRWSVVNTPLLASSYYCNTACNIRMNMYGTSGDPGFTIHLDNLRFATGCSGITTTTTTTTTTTSTTTTTTS